MMPSALRIARNTGVSPGRLLMPMSFGSLVGGLAVLVGTSPNIIVSEVRQEALGKPFKMFDFMPVGGTLAVMAIAYLAFAYRLLPKGRRRPSTSTRPWRPTPMSPRSRSPRDWSFEHSRIADLQKAAGEAVVGGGPAARPQAHRLAASQPQAPAGRRPAAGGAAAGTERADRQGQAEAGDADRPVVMDEPTDEVRVVEAVIGAESDLIGQTAKSLTLNDTYGVNLLGVSRAGYRMAGRLATVRMKAGDILVLQGAEQKLPTALAGPGLPAAGRARGAPGRLASRPAADRHPGRGHAAGGVRRAAGGRRLLRGPCWWSRPALCGCARPMRRWTPRCWCWWPP
jgi:di/tricarboxylate transporter